MLVIHRHTKQIIDVPNPEEYTKTGSWLLFEDAKLDGVYGNFAKTELKKVNFKLDEIDRPAQKVVVNFTDGLIE